LVCSDCRQYFKCYGEFPCLEPPGQQAASPDPCSNEEEIDFDEEEEIDEPDQDETKPLIQTQNSLGGELNLTAIERDSDLTGDNPELEDEVNFLVNTFGRFLLFNQFQINSAFVSFLEQCS
jgi:hypothetical protein